MIDVRNNYWIIGGSATDVYSSATNTMVPVGDQGYVDWCKGNFASSIANEAELADVLRAHGSQLPAWIFNASDTFIQPTPTTYSMAQLAAYSADARYRRASAGVKITTISSSTFLSDPVSRNTVNSAYDYSQAQGGSWSINWKMSDGSFVTLSKGSISTLMNNMAGFVQACFTCENNNLTAINAGTMTTLAQIDAAYAAVSNTFP
jgi:hypothetical protein